MNDEAPLIQYSTAHDHFWQSGPVTNGLTEAVCSCGSGIQYDASTLEIRDGKLVARV